MHTSIFWKCNPHVRLLVGSVGYKRAGSYAFIPSDHLLHVGWSVDTSKSLLRGEEDPDETESNLGELLKRKAEEGNK